MSTLRVNIFAATETWFTDSIDNLLVNMPNYSLLRDDRIHKKGGGVAIWINSFVNFCQITPDNHPNYLNALWLVLPSSRFLFVCIYIPPDSTISKKHEIDDYIITNCDRILSLYTNFEIFICGDLNRYDISTISLQLGLKNKVTEPTRNDAVLDFVLMSKPLSMVYEVTVSSPIANSDHKSIVASPKCALRATNFIYKTLYDLRKSNMDRALSSLSSVNWHSWYTSDMSVDDKCNSFHTILTTCVSANIPTSEIIMTASDKPWVTPLVKFLIQKRWDAYRAKNFTAYKHWKEKAHEAIRKAKLTWSQKSQRSTKDLWRIASTALGSKTIDPMLRLVNSLPPVSTTVKEINKLFTDIFIQDNRTHEENSTTTEWCPTIEVEQVHAALKNLKSSKAMGSDCIPTPIYKAAADFLAGPLAHIFNLSIQKRRVPLKWKFAHVIPVPKSIKS